MKKQKCLNKINIVEMHLYELLGIKLFKKAILIFERFKHIKDGGQNENYHLKNISNHTLFQFSGYLIYNAFFHIVSLLFAFLSFIVIYNSHQKNLATTIILVFVVIFDIYCLMLQRYTYLRLQQLINKKQLKKQQAKAAYITKISCALDEKPLQDIENELTFMQNIQAQLLLGKDIILKIDDEKVLHDIANVITNVQERKESNRESLSMNKTFLELTNSLPNSSKVISSIQRNVSTLQRMLKFSKRDNILFGICVITSSPKLEEFYQKIFPNDDLSSVLETLDILIEAYQSHQKERLQQ